MKRRVALLALSLGGAGLGLALAGHTLGPTPRLLVNESHSLPRGLYRWVGTVPHRGDVVAIRPPAVAAAYLASLGAPSDLPLLKRVAAMDGDRLCLDAAGLRWPGGATGPVADRDRTGRDLPNWRGCRRLGRDHLLVMGDSPSSFDSRYFGPVERGAVTGVYRELVRW